MKRPSPLQVAVFVVGILGGVPTALTGWRTTWAWLMEQRDQRRTTIERLNDLTLRVCTLEGGKWQSGECVQPDR